jgi:hypothetical protein
MHIYIRFRTNLLSDNLVSGILLYCGTGKIFSFNLDNLTWPIACDVNWTVCAQISVDPKIC